MLAVGIGIAGYSYLLSIRRGPVHTSEPTLMADALPGPRPPERLPPDQDFGRTAVPASVAREPLGAVAVNIRIRGLPVALLGPEAGVAMFAADMGTDFVWTPLTTAVAAADGSLLVTSTASTTSDRVITLAMSRGQARHGYLARMRHRPSSERGHAAAEAVLQVDASTVRFELPAGARRAGPLRLSRVDDPHWLPPREVSKGLLVAAGETPTLLLGAGEYALQDALTSDRQQNFRVPSPEPVVLSAGLTPARGDRP